MSRSITRAELAALLDHTLLAPEATDAAVEALCAEAVALGVGAVCVSPTRVTTARAALPPTIAVCSVVGFPSGAHKAAIKADEATRAVADGADEIDVVIDVGAAKAGDRDTLVAEVAEVRAVVPGVLKVILETAVLTADEREQAATAAVGGGADLLKTSTGFHPAGGATIEAVAALAKVAAAAGRTPPVGVKAAGGIRDAATALAMLDAGATRLGCSASRAILDGLEEVDRPA
jgi:deoxyribose-phosphate aldolase